MEHITLGDIATWAAWIAAFIGSVGVIVGAVRKTIKNLFDEQTKDINARLDKQEAAIKKVDLENCKNFLVAYLAKVEQEGPTNEIETARFWEEYQHYTDNGGNSYIKEKVAKLKSSGKL